MNFFSALGDVEDDDDMEQASQITVLLIIGFDQLCSIFLICRHSQGSNGYKANS